MCQLLKDCFAIAAGAYLSIYIANAPKYAIDAQLNEAAQAGFNYIFMPVYIVSTLSTFVFQPLIAKMAAYLEEGRRSVLVKLFMCLLAIIAGLCVFVLIGGYFLGIPALSWMYNFDLSEYKTAFMILLLGGGLLAYGSFFTVCIVIMRRQKLLLIAYLVPAIVEYFAADRVVSTNGVVGVAVLYTGLILLQSVMFFVILAFSYMKWERST